MWTCAKNTGYSEVAKYWFQFGTIFIGEVRLTWTFVRSLDLWRSFKWSEDFSQVDWKLSKGNQFINLDYEFWKTLWLNCKATA